MNAQTKSILDAAAKHRRIVKSSAVELKGAVAAVTKDGRSLQCAPAQLKSDKEVVLAAVAQEYASDEVGIRTVRWSMPRMSFR